MALNKTPNINYLWAQLIIEELIRNGVKYFCISPGSRSSALTMAVASNKSVKSFVHFDERGTAFHALGYASATKQPCAIITTSGTAVANTFPAIIEASKKKLPLIILTADRPPELRSTGAHQTIDQVKIFGAYVRWSCDLPCPTQDIKPSFVLTTVDQAVFRAKGELPGPVHINCMFREPLAPVKVKAGLSVYLKQLQRWQKSKSPFTSYTSPRRKFSVDEINNVVKRVRAIKSGILVCGKLSSSEEQSAVIRLAQKLNWPIFPDISSGLRLGRGQAHIIHYFDQLLLSQKLKGKFDGVLHLGGRMTSKRYYDFIEAEKLKDYIMVLNHPLRSDPFHIVTLRVQSKIVSFCEEISRKITQKKRSKLLLKLQTANRSMDTSIDKYFASKKRISECGLARTITQSIPKNEGFFISSSLPIREIDMFGAINKNPVLIGSNRGASGIDGTIATAAGFSEGLDKRSTLLLGDLSLLYDCNSLAMLKDLSHPIIIIVFNNNGGGIFNLLPIAKANQAFEKFFAAPHDLKFKKIAQVFKVNYSNPSTRNTFLESYQKALETKRSTLIEINTSRSQNVQILEELSVCIKRAVNRVL